MDRACDFPSIAPAANFTVFNPPGWGRAAYEPPNFIYIFGVEGCWVSDFCGNFCLWDPQTRMVLYPVEASEDRAIYHVVSEVYVMVYQGKSFGSANLPPLISSPSS